MSLPDLSPTLGRGTLDDMPDVRELAGSIPYIRNAHKSAGLDNIFVFQLCSGRDMQCGHSVMIIIIIIIMMMMMMMMMINRFV